MDEHSANSVLFRYFPSKSVWKVTGCFLQRPEIINVDGARVNEETVGSKSHKQYFALPVNRLVWQYVDLSPCEVIGSAIQLRSCTLSRHPFWTAEEVMNDIAASSVALDCIRQFNAVSTNRQRMHFPLTTEVFGLRVGSTVVRVDMPDPFSSEMWEKEKEIAENPRLSSERIALFDSLSHFSWHISGHKFAVVIRQMLGSNALSFFVHTNSVQLPIPFGTKLNGGLKALFELEKCHQCNDVCREMKLSPLVVW